jgi:F-type H+-transporting ATPase subunit gamma
MKKLKQIEQELNDVGMLKDLTSTFESIAAQNLANTRNKVLSARAFLEEAQKVYTEARDIFITEHKLVQKKLEYHEQLSIRQDNGKHLSIVIAPNTKLYGALPDQLLNSVTEEIRKEPRDVLVLGKVAEDHFARLKPPIPFTAIPVEDEDFTVEQISKIVHHVSGYRKGTAYYNHFRTILTADVLEAPLTLVTVENKSDQPAEPEPEPKGLAKFIKKDDALFEPSLEEVLNFFETTIMKTLLRQKVRESLLSRYAARMVAMDVATENAKTAAKGLQRDMRRAKRLRANQRMLDSYSGMSLWKG